MTTSHEPAYPEDGMPKERYLAYHLERARAGVALTMTAGSAAVSRDSPPVFNNILAYKDEVVPWMRQLTDACHDHGCAVMLQLTHLGRRTQWNKGDWLPVVSSSHRREASHRAFPKQLEEWDIKRIQQDYIDAAERMHAAGLDGIELQAYGHLMDQFWSPLTNTLENDFGGSLENRLRFTLEILQGIRQRVGQDFIVGIRYTADEVIQGGINEIEGLAISQILADSNLIDFLNVIRGHIDTDPALTDVIPIQGMPSAPHLDFAGKVRKQTHIPTFHAARIGDVSTARHAIASGQLDMVGLTRPHMADPHIVQKIVDQREQDIRPCVGANYCLDRIYQGGEALCIHNPSTGRELQLPHNTPVATIKRKIIIVGAGPAGLEAARVCAERGHEVIVFEAASDPGGQIRLAAQDKRRIEMLAIIDWRFAQCDKLGVTFKFNTWAEVDDIDSESPDVVIIATGGYPNTDVLTQGNELVFSSWDIIAGDVKPADNILIFDDAGDHPALQAADICATSGAKVEIMTPDRSFAPDVMAMNLVPYMRRLQAKNVTFNVTYRLLSVQKNTHNLTTTIGTDYSDYQYQTEYDQVIINHGTLPLDSLYFDLKPHSVNLGELDQQRFIQIKAQKIHTNPQGKFELYRIGDAVSARNTHAAIYDALRLSRAL